MGDFHLVIRELGNCLSVLTFAKKSPGYTYQTYFPLKWNHTFCLFHKRGHGRQRIRRNEGSVNSRRQGSMCFFEWGCVVELGWYSVGDLSHENRKLKKQTTQHSKTVTSRPLQRRNTNSMASILPLHKLFADKEYMQYRVKAEFMHKAGEPAFCRIYFMFLSPFKPTEIILPPPLKNWHWHLTHTLWVAHE